MTGPPCIPWHDIGVFPRFCFVVGASCLGGPPSAPNRDDVGDDVGDEGWRSRRFDLLSKAENTILHGNFTLFTRKKACIFLSWIPKPTSIDIDQKIRATGKLPFSGNFSMARRRKKERKKKRKKRKRKRKKEEKEREKKEKKEKKKEKRGKERGGKNRKKNKKRR